jgi:hypothetical protein
MSTAVQQAAFSVSWTTTYPSLLSEAKGRMVTRPAYAAVFDARRPELRLPWEGYADWNRFWAYYLGSPEKFRELTSDAGWDRVVPLEWVHTATLTPPHGVDARVDVLVYPTAISVIVRGLASGSWSLKQLASKLEDVRKSKSWGLSGTSTSSTNRSLDGIAEDLRAEAVRWLTDGAPPETGSQAVLTVAAPIAGKGPVASFVPKEKTAAGSCLAGLSVLGSPGSFVASHLLEENSDPRCGARVYALPGGHAIWHPARFVKRSEAEPIKCLVDNQTDLVAHISALAGIASWAGEQVKVHVQIPTAVQPLVERAVLRLCQLHNGPREKTYRSGIAKTRIEPLIPTLKQVGTTLGVECDLP